MPAMLQALNLNTMFFQKTNQFLAIILVIGLFLQSCNQNYKTQTDADSILIDYHTKSIIGFEKFFDFSNSSLIILGGIDSIILSSRLEVIVAENDIFILDALSKQLFRFDSNGQFSNFVGRPGSGPGEYNNATFFQVDGKTETVDVLCNSGSTIKTYGYEGEYLKSFVTPIIATSFARINNNKYFFYTGYYGCPEHYRLHLADTTKILKSFLQLKTLAFDAIEPNFSSFGESGYFRELFLPSVYLYNENGIQEVFRFNFGGFEVSGKQLQQVKDPVDFLNESLQRGFCSTIGAFKGQNWACVLITQQEKEIAKLSHFYINLSDSSYFKVVNNRRDAIFESFFYNFRLIHIDSSDYAYFLIDPLELNEFFNSHKTNLRFHYDSQKRNPALLKVPLSR